MDYINHRLHWLDRLQRSHPIFGFPFAVIKKYSDDKGGYQAALLTYYGFLSLFPTLLLTTTAMQWFLHADSHLKQRVISSVTNYFPIIGQQLQQNVHGFSKTGLPFLIGLLVLLYGLRGTADVFRQTVNNIWHVPIDKRSGFWSSLARNFTIVGIGGAGFIASAITASYAASSRHNLLLHILLILLSAFFIFCTYMVVLKISLSREVRVRRMWVGAAITTIGLLALQTLGGLILKHELKNLNNLFGTFAVVLGLFFWLYLQTQFLVYAMETDTVRIKKLWPRSFMGKD
ncbi:MAG TPA: YihY/virulence factor BrkB family protein [Candidatus Microsaccharimonas sp.]|nr:YihY/virulence factor BrkB family protein [Candidatus Microsaccharimonas sp.]